MSWLNLSERVGENLSKNNKFLVEQPTACVTRTSSGGMGLVQRDWFDLALGNMGAAEDNASFPYRTVRV